MPILCFWYRFSQCILSSATSKFLFNISSSQAAGWCLKKLSLWCREWTQKLNILSKNQAQRLPGMVCATPKILTELGVQPQILTELSVQPQISSQNWVCHPKSSQDWVCDPKSSQNWVCNPNRNSFKSNFFFLFHPQKIKKIINIIRIMRLLNTQEQISFLNIFTSLSCIKADSRGQVRHCWWNFSFSPFIYRSSFSDSSNSSDFLKSRI